MFEISVDDKVYRRQDVNNENPPQHANARQLYDYWQDKRGDRKFPSWRDIDLLDLWQIVPCMIVKDVIGDGHDFRNRFWGTQVAHRAGFDGTGRTHRGIYKDQPLGPQMETYQQVVNSGCGNSVYRSSTFITDREFVIFNSLNLPLGQADNRVENIIIAIDYE